MSDANERTAKEQANTSLDQTSSREARRLSHQSAKNGELARQLTAEERARVGGRAFGWRRSQTFQAAGKDESDRHSEATPSTMSGVTSSRLRTAPAISEREPSRLIPRGTPLENSCRRAKARGVNAGSARPARESFSAMYRSVSDRVSAGSRIVSSPVDRAANAWKGRWRVSCRRNDCTTVSLPPGLDSRCESRSRSRQSASSTRKWASSTTSTA